jgi:hypothetical protein
MMWSFHCLRHGLCGQALLFGCLMNLFRLLSFDSRIGFVRAPRAVVRHWICPASTGVVGGITHVLYVVHEIRRICAAA